MSNTDLCHGYSSFFIMKTGNKRHIVDCSLLEIVCVRYCCFLINCVNMCCLSEGSLFFLLFATTLPIMLIFVVYLAASPLGVPAECLANLFL